MYRGGWFDTGGQSQGMMDKCGKCGHYLLRGTVITRLDNPLRFKIKDDDDEIWDWIPDKTNEHLLYKIQMHTKLVHCPECITTRIERLPVGQETLI